MCLFANRSSSSAHIMVLPKISFFSPLYSIPFSFSAKVTICGTHIMASVRVLSQQGRFKRYSLFGTLSSVTRSETKPLPSDTPTLKLINEVHVLTIEHSV